MRKLGIVGAIAAAACALALFAGCSAADTSKSNSAGEAEHPTITMNAPYRNMSQFVDLVHEKYPEINLEVIPYNGQNTTSYMRDMRGSGQMTDIYFSTVYTPGRDDDKADFLDLSSLDFTSNFAQSRLREVTYDGGVYMLPLSYNALGITYNKTLLDANGWTLPTNLTELSELKEKVEAAGYTFCRNQLELPGYGFQFLCNIADTGFLSTTSGLSWQQSFLRGEATVAGTPEMVENLKLLDTWREIGMLNADGTPSSDTATKADYVKGNTLFLVGNSNDLSSAYETTDEFRLMPYLSVDGTQNVFVLNVSRFVGLNKQLGEAGNEQKLEDAMHVMEILSTTEGIESLDPTQNNSRLLPLKDSTVGEDSYYSTILDELDAGHTANFIYSGWESLIVPIGQKMLDFVKGTASLDDVIACFDDNQHLVTDPEKSYTTAVETIGTEDCARAIGIAFAQATNSQAALISVNEWKYNLDAAEMNKRGVSGCLFPVPVCDQQIVSILPTGWAGKINMVTLSGARIKELAQTGFDWYGTGDTFPYVLVTKDGSDLDDTTEYTIPVCGVTDAVASEGNQFESDVLGLDAARSYFSGFDTLSAQDIRWE